MFLYWDLKVLAQNLYLDSSVEASGQCTGERANGLDGTATTADDLSDVILGDETSIVEASSPSMTSRLTESGSSTI